MNRAVHSITVVEVIEVEAADVVEWKQWWFIRYVGPGKLLEFVSSLLLRKNEQEDPPKYQTKVNFKGILMLIG